MISVRISSYGCTQEVWRARKLVRVARGAAESNSSYLSALQTSQGLLWMAFIHRDFTEKSQFMATQNSTEQLPVLSYVISQIVRSALYCLKKKKRRKDSFNIISSSIFDSNSCVRSYFWTSRTRDKHSFEITAWNVFMLKYCSSCQTTIDGSISHQSIQSHIMIHLHN